MWNNHLWQFCRAVGDPGENYQGAQVRMVLMVNFSFFEIIIFALLLLYVT